MVALDKFLNGDLFRNLFAYAPKPYQERQNVLAQMMNFGINMSKEMRAAVKTFRDVNVLGELKNIEETLTQTLLSHTEGMLIDKFEIMIWVYNSVICKSFFQVASYL